jgi:hypothetical protein
MSFRAYVGANRPFVGRAPQGAVILICESCQMRIPIPRIRIESQGPFGCGNCANAGAEIEMKPEQETHA